MNDNQVVCEIRWCVSDVRSALEIAGYEPSDENVQKALDNRLERTMEEMSVQYGWEFLNVIVTDAGIDTDGEEDV